MIRSSKRRIRWCIAAVLVLLIGPYLYSRIAADRRMVQTIASPHDVAAPASQPREDISILIYNIAHGRGAAASNLHEGGPAKKIRISEIAELLVRQNADLVILNEADFYSTWSGHQNQAQALAEQAGYLYRAEQRNLDFRFVYGSWQFGNSILSKFPITNFRIIDYPPHSQWEPWLVGKKNGAIFSIDLGDGRALDIAPVHLEHRSEGKRVQAVEKILRLKLPQPPILAGDFNSTPTGTPGSVLTAQGQNAMDRLIASDLFWPPQLPQGSSVSKFTFSTDRPRKTIDWIMVPKRYRVLEYRIIETNLSDHRPVFARIALTPQVERE